MRVNGRNFGPGRLAAVLSLAASLSSAAVAPAFAAGPFTNFPGEWSGTGDITLSDGSRDRIKCKASYSTSPSGEALNINVNCASDSYRVNIISNVVAEGSSFAGTWRETTRQVNGDVTGRVPALGEYQASLSGTGFGIELAATSNGKVQAINITSQGTDVQSVKISLLNISFKKRGGSAGRGDPSPADTSLIPRRPCRSGRRRSDAPSRPGRSWSGAG